MVAPDLIAVEVASAIARRCRLGQLSENDALRLLAAWTASLDDLLRLVSSRVDLDAAGRLACELRHPLVDCLYLATAMRLGQPLITADKLFAARAVSASPELNTL